MYCKLKVSTKDRFCIQLFHPKTHPWTFCNVLLKISVQGVHFIIVLLADLEESAQVNRFQQTPCFRCSIERHCRNVLDCVIGRKHYRYKTPPLKVTNLERLEDCKQDVQTPRGPYTGCLINITSKIAIIKVIITCRH